MNCIHRVNLIILSSSVFKKTKKKHYNHSFQISIVYFWGFSNYSFTDTETAIDIKIDYNTLVFAYVAWIGYRYKNEIDYSTFVFALRLFTLSHLDPTNRKRLYTMDRTRNNSDLSSISVYYFICGDCSISICKRHYKH